VAGGLDIVIPVGLNGLRMQSSIARSQLVLPSSNSTNPSSTTGFSNTVSLGLAYPWIRGLDFNLSTTVNALGAFSEYGQSNVTTSKKTIYAGQFSLAANSGDRSLLLDEDTWSVQSTLTMGQVSDAAAINITSAPYSKLAFQAIKKKPLWSEQAVYAFINFRGQWANVNLDAYEKLLLTGINGARAYSPDQGTVDQGFIASIDIRKDINTAWGRITPGVFFDYANGSINKVPYENWQINNGYSNPAQSNNLTFSNYGVSLNLTGFKNTGLSMSWAKQMNASPSMLGVVSNDNSQFWFALRTQY
jgi:hemolysin activation/secretion protein